MRTRVYLYITILSAVALSVSCSTKEMSVAELNRYILEEKNGLIKKISKNGVELEVLFRPSRLVAAQQLTGITDVTERHKIKSEFDTLNYFVLHLSRKGAEIENSFVSTPSQFTELIDYLSFGVSRDIYLVIGRDTVRALDAVYARTFGSADATSVIVVFGGGALKKNGDPIFCFDDSVVGTGLTKFPFKKDDLEEVPTLIIE